MDDSPQSSSPKSSPKGSDSADSPTRGSPFRSASTPSMRRPGSASYAELFAKIGPETRGLASRDDWLKRIDTRRKQFLSSELGLSALKSKRPGSRESTPDAPDSPMSASSRGTLMPAHAESLAGRAGLERRKTIDKLVSDNQQKEKSQKLVRQQTAFTRNTVYLDEEEEDYNELIDMHFPVCRILGYSAQEAFLSHKNEAALSKGLRRRSVMTGLQADLEAAARKETINNRCVKQACEGLRMAIFNDLRGVQQGEAGPSPGGPRGSRPGTPSDKKPATPSDKAKKPSATRIKSVVTSTLETLASDTRTRQSFRGVSDTLAEDFDDVRAVFRWWEKLDPNFVGLIRTTDLLTELLVTRNQADDHFRGRRMELGAHALTRLVSPAVAVEDFVAIIWPERDKTARREILSIIAYLVCVSMVVQPPPCLDDKSRLDYLAVFEQMDLDGSGSLELDELEETGLFTPQDFAEIVQRYDTDGDGCIDMVEFLELVTPEGFRGHTFCTSCNTTDGERVLLYEFLKGLPTTFRGWMKETVALKVPSNKMLKALGIRRGDYPLQLSWKDLHPPDANIERLQLEMKRIDDYGALAEQSDSDSEG